MAVSDAEQLRRDIAKRRTGCRMCCARDRGPKDWHCQFHQHAPIIVFDEGFCAQWAEEVVCCDSPAPKCWDCPQPKVRPWMLILGLPVLVSVVLIAVQLLSRAGV